MTIDFEGIESSFRTTDDGKCCEGQNGLISTQSRFATEVGAQILKDGGNAVDAAVAAAMALGVSEPQASGIGGQTMALIGDRDGNNVIAIDGSSRAPSLAHPSAINRRDKAIGYRASTVPSTLATLGYIQEKYGSLSWEAVVEPAVELAKTGFPISALQSKLMAREQKTSKK